MPRFGGPSIHVLCLAASLAASGHMAAPAGETRGLPTVSESGITVSIEGWAGISPTSMSGRDAGFLPLVLTITNGSTGDRVWTIEPARLFGSGVGIVPVTQLAVPAGGVGRITLYVDPGPSGSNAYGGAYLNVRGYGLYNGSQWVEVERWNPPVSSSLSGTPKPFFPSAISQAAFSKGRERGLEQFQVVGELDLAAAPEDWRGWSVFSQLLCDESEWIAMSAGQRKALLDWVGLGGRAGLLVTDASSKRLDEIGLPAADAEGRRRVGAGELVAVEWDGSQLDPQRLDSFLSGSRLIMYDKPLASEELDSYRYEKLLHPRSDQLSSYSTSDRSNGPLFWNGGFSQLFDLFGPRQLPVAAILVFLAVFGLVAGPLNLMLFAGPRRRSRMFWTTPLISLLATLLLLGLIFFRDGIGGAGARRMLCLLMPDQNGMAIIQEQFSRTGVLLGGSFPIREPSWMRPLDDVTGAAPLLEVDGRAREGGWFSSRSDQGYLLEAVRPSRAGIELVAADGDTPPAAISSIEVPLDRLFVIDDEGGYWTAGDVGTGERKPLEPSDADAFNRWFREISADAGSVRRAAFDAVQNRRGHAYAEASDAGRIAITTLESIRWIDDKAIFIGPLTRTAAP